MEIKIAKTKQEISDAFAVRKTVFVDEQQVPLEIELDEHEGTATHFVAYNVETPIAAGRIRFFDHFGKIERICVLKPYRKSGIGGQLMNFIEQFALEQGYKTVKLNAQRHAERFYKHLGYLTVSEEFFEAGIPHVTMVKEIKS